MVHVRSALFVEQRQQPYLLPHPEIQSQGKGRRGGSLSGAAQLRPFRQRRLESVRRARCVVAEQVGPVDNLRWQPDRRVGPVA